MKNKQLRWLLLIFVVILAAFYYGLSKTTDLWDQKMPVLSYVEPFSFINQAGKTITEKDIQGKVAVVEYFFTTCKGICPKMNRNMQGIYAKYGKEPSFVILSHTVDPDRDTVGRMKFYADSLGANPNNWWFLTGSKDSLYRKARVSYLLDDPKANVGPIEEQFIHTQFFALVDKEGQVRKIYDGLKPEELKELEIDIATLLAD